MRCLTCDYAYSETAPCKCGKLAPVDFHPPVSDEEASRCVNSADPGEVIEEQSHQQDQVDSLLNEPAKTTAWTDAQQEAHVKIAEKIAASGAGEEGQELTGLELDLGRELTDEERKALPPWAEQLRPGRGVAIDGWITRIVLIDPKRSMLLLFVEGPSAGMSKKVKAAMKKASPKKRGSRTPKGTIPPPRARSK